MFVFSLQFAVIRIAETDKVWQRENATISLSRANCYLVEHAGYAAVHVRASVWGDKAVRFKAIVRVEAL